jgi:hypothetical protein
VLPSPNDSIVEGEPEQLVAVELPENENAILAAADEGIVIEQESEHAGVTATVVVAVTVPPGPVAVSE